MSLIPIDLFRQFNILKLILMFIERMKMHTVITTRTYKNL